MLCTRTLLPKPLSLLYVTLHPCWLDAQHSVALSAVVLQLLPWLLPPPVSLRGVLPQETLLVVVAAALAEKQALLVLV